MEPYFHDLDKMRSEIQKWVLIMVALAVASFFLNIIAKFSFGRVGENITLNVRQNLYRSILIKHIGWHDNPENATGILSTMLAQDVQTLNGVSTEALGVMAEAMSAMLGGLIIAFIFAWQVALVALAVVPFMVIGGIISAKMDAQNAGNDEEGTEFGSQKKKEMDIKKQAMNPDLLANDSIQNFRTVMGFGLNEGIKNQYTKLLAPDLNTANKTAHCAGIIFGYSKFIENACIAIILFAGTALMLKIDGLDGEGV